VVLSVISIRSSTKKKLPRLTYKPPRCPTLLIDNLERHHPAIAIHMPILCLTVLTCT
jgi:hypothetical protein